MSTTEVQVEQEAIVQRTPRQIAWARFKRNRAGVISGYVALFFVVAAFAAPLITKLLGLKNGQTYPEAIDEQSFPIGSFGGISLKHPLGVEPGAGRDLLTMLLYGSRISFTVAIITTVSSIGLGMLIGLTVGYFRGKVDAVVGRFSDFLLSFPSTFMIIALSLPLVQRVEALHIAKDNGARVIVLIVFFVFFGWMGFARLIRSQVLSLREKDFVTAAQAMGASRVRIIFKELLPNIWAPIIVVASLSLPGYLAAESTFSYLGLGVQPPASTWGILLSNATRFVTTMPSFFLIVAGSLVIVVLAFNLVGDAVRDALDPRTER